MLTHEHARLGGDGRPVLDPRARRDRRPRLGSLASRLDHGARQPRGRRHDPARDDRRRPDERDGQRPGRTSRLEGRYYTDKSTKITYQNMVILARTGPVLHRPGAARRRRGDHPPAGSGQRHVQHGPCGPSSDVRIVDAVHARRDDEPADRQVRPAGAGDLPARQRPAPDAARRRRPPRPRPTPSPSASPSAPPAAP